MHPRHTLNIASITFAAALFSALAAPALHVRGTGDDVAAPRLAERVADLFEQGSRALAHDLYLDRTAATPENAAPRRQLPVVEMILQRQRAETLKAAGRATQR